MSARCSSENPTCPHKVLILLLAIPFAALAAIYAEIGYALHRAISALRRFANLS